MLSYKTSDYFDSILFLFKMFPSSVKVNLVLHQRAVYVFSKWSTAILYFVRVIYFLHYFFIKMGALGQEEATKLSTVMSRQSQVKGQKHYT